MPIPMNTICNPYDIQSGLEYIKDDSGPITDWPWKWNIVPKTVMIPPDIATVVPTFMINMLCLV